MNTIGFHIVDGQFTDAQVAQHFALLDATRPAAITILGASQYEQALAFAIRVKQAFPDTRVIFRHYRDGSDDGMHTRLSAVDWWAKIGSLYIGTGLTILSDNESSMEDYTPYAKWQAEVITRAGNAGVGIAFGRFPTHHVAPSKVQMLDAMLIASFKYGKLMTFSPNVYWAADNLDGLKYPGYVIAYAEKLGIPLNTTIGEFALLRDIRDAYHGWRDCGISGTAYALDLILKAKTHLPGIPVCTYSIGQWPIAADTFSLDNDVLQYIKNHLTPLDAPPIVIPPQENPPVPDTWITQTAATPSPDVRTNIRAAANTSAEIIARILPTNPITAQVAIPSPLPAPPYWMRIKFDAIDGWVRSDAVALSDVVETPQPPRLPIDEEWRRYFLEQLTMMEYHLQEAYNIGAICRSMMDEIVNAPTAIQKLAAGIAQLVRKL